MYAKPLAHTCQRAPRTSRAQTPTRLTNDTTTYNNYIPNTSLYFGKRTHQFLRKNIKRRPEDNNTVASPRKNPRLRTHNNINKTKASPTRPFPTSKSKREQETKTCPKLYILVPHSERSSKHTRTVVWVKMSISWYVLLFHFLHLAQPTYANQ